jgi:flagellar hook-associated protein 2
MSSPITLSGFNNIDFTTVLNALMQQESIPLNSLINHQTGLQSENSAYGLLATKLSALDSAASALGTASTVTTYSAVSSNPAAVAASAGDGVVAGRYDVVVNALARAQVTVANTTSPDADTTTVATAGTLTIGGAAVHVAAPVTLQGLADQINQTDNIGVTASVIQSAPGAYRLVLSSHETGQANAFTIANALTGGGGVGFVDTNNDGISGDSNADNAVNAKNASVTVNNIAVTSTTNTLTAAIPGVTLTLNQEDPGASTSIAVGRDNADLTSRVNAFVTAYNSLVLFTNSQRSAAASGTDGTLARDPVLQGVRGQLRDALLGAYGGGSFHYLSEIGIGPDQNGLLTLDASTFASALAANPTGVEHLFTGSNNDGAFASIHTVLQQYTQAGGFIPSAQSAVTDQLSRVAASITALQARLALKRTALQQQFTAADAAMAQLNSQSSSLSAFGVALSGGSLKSS